MRLTGVAAVAAVASAAAALLLAPAASATPLIEGDPQVIGPPFVSVPPQGSGVVFVQVRHQGLSKASLGRVHRDSATYVGVVSAAVLGPDGAVLARTGTSERLLLRRSLTSHFLTLGPAAVARLRATGATRLSVRITALDRLGASGTGRPLETESAITTRQGVATPAKTRRREARPACDRLTRSAATVGRTTRLVWRCVGDGVTFTVNRPTSRGTAKIVSKKNGRLVIDYRPGPSQRLPDAFVIRATNEAGAVSVGRLVFPRSFRLRALGDSVTGGFGYLGTGAPWSVVDLPDCIPPTPLNDRCTSNSPNSVGNDGPVGWLPDFGLSNNVAWPAQFANANGIAGSAFANYAVSGSRPVDWDKKSSINPRNGALNATLAKIVADQPDLTVMTLGANPLLDVFLAGRGIECEATLSDAAFRKCIRGFISDQKLVPRVRSVIRQLLVAPSNRVVVSQYHSAIPSATVFSVDDLRIMFQELNSAVSSAARGAPGFGKRVFLMAPPPFPVGLGPGEAICPNPGTRPPVDGQSRQSDVTQDELDLLHPTTFCDSDTFWIISQDTGIHPSREGHAQFAASLQKVVDENNLMPATSAPTTP